MNFALDEKCKWMFIFMMKKSPKTQLCNYKLNLT